MSIIFDRNCNIIIDSVRTGYVAVGAHSVSGIVALHKGLGHHEPTEGRMTHITETAGPVLWSGHVTALTQDVFLSVTGLRAPDTIIIKAPAGTKASWVHQSQADGFKLSDWIIKKVEQA